MRTAFVVVLEAIDQERRRSTVPGSAGGDRAVDAAQRVLALQLLAPAGLGTAGLEAAEDQSHTETSRSHRSPQGNCRVQ